MAGKRTEMTAYCGLYCGECSFCEGTIPDLARDLRKELRKVRFDKVAEAIPFMDSEKYQEAYEFMGNLVKLRCKGCKVGGRSKFCEIAKCAIKRGYEGCWECGEFADCGKMDFLVPVHGDAHIKNLRKIKKVGVNRWVDEGPLLYSPVRKKKT
ncbi:MAG: DUF3795 domain-containing protein [Actinomycetota bacterium]|nr:DUF3795 domain-containing protein [Actinomycetota bacterium]